MEGTTSADAKRVHAFDLGTRTEAFGEAIVKFAKSIPHTPVTIRLIPQLVASATSVGANYCEADEAVSKRDFRFIVSRCQKEARETKYWLRMIATAEPRLKPETRVLWQEAKELHLIFSAIRRRTPTD